MNVKFSDFELKNFECWARQIWWDTNVKERDKHFGQNLISNRKNYTNVNIWWRKDQNPKIFENFYESCHKWAELYVVWKWLDMSILFKFCLIIPVAISLSHIISHLMVWWHKLMSWQKVRKLSKWDNIKSKKGYIICFLKICDQLNSLDWVYYYIIECGNNFIFLFKTMYAMFPIWMATIMKQTLTANQLIWGEMLDEVWRLIVVWMCVFAIYLIIFASNRTVKRLIQFAWIEVDLHNFWKLFFDVP